jgi:hypothetical protein
MSTGSGTIVPITPTPTPAATAGQLGQIYCTVNDLLLDPAPPAGSIELLFAQIQAASKTIQQEIGEFIPVSETRKFQGGGNDKLFIPPLLALTGSIVDDETGTLAAADFIYQPDGRHWRNGPYSWLEVAEDPVSLGAWSTEREGVAIPGRWGLYEETEDTGATVAAIQDNSQVGLQVNDGAQISPGAVLLIGSEQELISGYDTPVAAVTTLNGGIDAVQETLILANGALVNIGEIIRIDVEQMRILDIATNTLYVQRHWNKTLGAAHTTSSTVDVYRKFVVARALNGTTAAAHAISAGVSRYLVPGDILFLCKEIATLMINKASSGYAGKSGNAELGQVYYNDAFPRFDLERIREHYRIPGA